LARSTRLATARRSAPSSASGGRDGRPLVASVQDGKARRAPDAAATADVRDVSFDAGFVVASGGCWLGSCSTFMRDSRQPPRYGSAALGASTEG